MKPFTRDTFVLLNGLGLILAGQLSAQTIASLHSFGGNVSDGLGPRAELILSGNTLFGTTTSGGSFSRGTVFKINTDGTDFTNLYSFSTPQYNALGVYTNSDV